MTDCAMGELRDLLPLLAHDALPPAEASRVRAHVAECAECRAELALLETLRARFDAVTPAISTAAIAAGVQRATVASGRQGLALVRPARRRGTWLPRQYLAAAASLLLVGTLSLAVLGREFGGRDGVTVDVDSTRVVGGLDSAPAGPAAASTALSVADGLDDLDAAALTTLLNELESFEATVAAEPVSLRQPLVESPGGF